VWGFAYAVYEPGGHVAELYIEGYIYIYRERDIEGRGG
jgi:hypothetical protein